MTNSKVIQDNNKFPDSSQVIWFKDIPKEGFWKLDPAIDGNSIYVDEKGATIQDPYVPTGKYLTRSKYHEYLWTHGLPIGNGRMGAMVMGTIDKEVLQINEDTVWTGAPYVDSFDKPTGGSTKDAWKFYRGVNDDGSPAAIGTKPGTISYNALRIDNSCNSDAVQYRYNLHKQVENHFLGTPQRQKTYQTFVEVYLDFGHKNEGVTNYIRSLDLATAVAVVEYDYNGVHYRRENFASYPDQAIVTHLTASGSKNLNFTAELHTFHGENAEWLKISDNQIALKSKPSGDSNLIKFEARLLIDAPDANIEIGEDNKTITISGANEATLYIVGATNYVNYLILDDSKPAEDCNNYITLLREKTYEQIKAAHISDYSALYNRSSLKIANTGHGSYSSIPTDRRIRPEGFTVGIDKLRGSTFDSGDNELAVLLFNYGKYLMISGSRPKSQPLNLQGIWNATNTPAWSSKFTININTEMNYWMAQVLNLSECEQPLFDAISDLAESGAITAKEHYNIEGNGAWVMHHNFDLWRGTQPINNATSGLWPTGGIWLLWHVWQAYLFNKDKAELAKYYPYMKGACEFFNKFLVQDPETGYLITAASVSPEQGGVQPGPAMDTQLVRSLYLMTLKAASELNKTSEDASLLDEIRDKLPKVAPNLIDDNGYIKEWVRGDVTFDMQKDTSDNPEFIVTDPYTGQQASLKQHPVSIRHKHCSHLWEVFPGPSFNQYNLTPTERKVFEAFKKSIIARGKELDTGWALAWRINLRARILDAEGAYDLIRKLLSFRTSPNLFDQHPPFQIDGNFGFSSGVAEMLLQSHEDTINILPVLPEQWPFGEFRGFRARGNFEVDVKWDNRIPSIVRIHSKSGGKAKVRNPYSASASVTDDSGNGVLFTREENNTVLVFDTEAGKSYVITGYGI